jgi:predicted transcriptional regulator
MREWDKEDPYDMNFRSGYFKSREEAEKKIQQTFDKLKAEGKISESLQTAVMSDKIAVGIKYLVYQSMIDTRNEMYKMASKAGRPIDKGSLFLNYSNMMLQVVRALIQESLELEYDLALEFEMLNEKLKGYKDKMGFK